MMTIMTTILLIIIAIITLTKVLLHKSEAQNADDEGKRSSDA